MSKNRENEEFTGLVTKMSELKNQI